MVKCKYQCLVTLAAFYLHYVNAVLDEGDSCTGNDGINGTCVLLPKCPQIGDFKVKRPLICTIKGLVPVICCPPVGTSLHNTTNQTRDVVHVSKANKMCNVWRKSKFCEDIRLRTELDDSNRLMGGLPAMPQVYPSMALIGYGEADSIAWSCGGNLISERWILSAAHCARLKNIGPARWARLGDLDISSVLDDAQPQVQKITKIKVHPEYKAPEVYNDIVLFKVDSPFTFNGYVSPICLHTSDEIPVSKATITGYGRMGFLEDQSDQLLEAEISLVNDSECTELYNFNDTNMPRGIDIETMVCAGDKLGRKNTCPGDSGGPLLYNLDDCMKSLIGITSYGKECDLPDSPSLYTRVSKYITWIEAIVWPNL